MWRATLAVASKELREAVRDRRSLMAALFYAVWGPAVMAIALVALARDRGPETPLSLPVVGGPGAASLVAFLEERSVTVLASPPEAAAHVRARSAPVVLVVDDSYPEDFQSARPARVTMLYDGSWRTSTADASRVRTLLTEYNRRIADSRLILRGISPSAISPVRVLERDLSTSADRAAAVLGTLPIFVLLAAFIGAMGLAADLTAGERERGSLESLLLNPVPAAALVVGKWLVASTLAIVTVLLTLAVCRLVVEHPRIQAIDLPVGLSLDDALTIFLLMIPLALLAPAVQLLIALFARTYKEAQTHLSLLVFLPMLPGFMFAFGSVDEQMWMRWTPMVGQHLMIGDVLRGLSLGQRWAAGLAALTFAATLAALIATARLLGRESLIRRG
jgi:sodium transport system permease protein